MLWRRLYHETVTPMKGRLVHFDCKDADFFLKYKIIDIIFVDFL